MNKILMIVAGVVAALMLLIGTFVTAAGMMGANLSQLPLVGALFPEPTEASVSPTGDEPMPTIEEQVSRDPRSDEQVIDMSATPLKAFLLPTPWNATELEALETQLKNRLGELREREKAIEAREQDLAESQRHLAELQAELESVRTGLIQERDETVSMQEEAAREEDAAKQRRLAGLKRMSSLFSDGDPEESARMLVDTYSADEAGIVLSGLSEERVRELMQGIRTANPEVLTDIEKSYREATSQP
ncbi:MAG: hypothetical protein R3F17_01245 [Planctomycetota bacterium]